MTSVQDRPQAAGQDEAAEDSGVDWLELALPLAQNLKTLILGSLAVGLAALGLSYALPNVYASRTVFLPPQQQQSAAASTLAQLGALSGLAGLAPGLKSPADQYVSLLQSTAVADRLIDEFKLNQVYGVDFRFKARKRLADNSRILLGRKDGLITIEVEDTDPQRAAAMANRYVDELRRLTSQLALTDAQQRRLFFENQLSQSRDRLTKAQQSLQASGFSQSAVRTDARASAEGYARLRAEATAVEVRLQVLRRNLAEDTPEVQQALSALTSLRAQLGKLEQATDLNGAPDYVSKFREFKYHETLFELLARQYELARLDESREGALIQVVDEAKPAEWKSRPKRALVGLAATLAGAFSLAGFFIARHAWRLAAHRPATAAKVAALRAAFGRRARAT
jgi:uncharacterized protein involved in exopolysaccharide biosynthesis